jgi:hypothetical protein
LQNAKRFLDGVVGNYSPAVLRDVFLESAPKAIEMLESSSDVKFRPYATHPDYEQVEGHHARPRD